MSTLLLLASGIAASSAVIELTGLVEVGGCRMASLRISSNAQFFVLRRGDHANGVTLLELNARAGWALLEVNGVTARVRLPSFCAKQASVSTRSGDYSRPMQGSGRGGFLTEPEPGVPSADQRTPGAGFPGQSIPAGPIGFSGGPNSESHAVGSSPTVPSENQLPDHSPASGAEVQNDRQSATSSTPDPFADRRRAYEAALESDPTYQEGERIKSQFGLQAFLAWDLARGQAALEGK